MAQNRADSAVDTGPEEVVCFYYNSPCLGGAVSQRTDLYSEVTEVQEESEKNFEMNLSKIFKNNKR